MNYAQKAVRKALKGLKKATKCRKAADKALDTGIVSVAVTSATGKVFTVPLFGSEMARIMQELNDDICSAAFARQLEAERNLAYWTEEAALLDKQAEATAANEGEGRTV
ncbi:hypothetical protein [Hymenobacter arizonensis]|uniref:Uncharacterized protein n=1 Tax=Hymenobacter arizonensis TaxID=1227077 RepID=A0A1I5T7P2_HYMAR|nr:hypothetical protein [Hymenobacter arizonensis]SFP79059.1 hypothetical protein SAMN04515668_0352 [Hymenobacter arizonensis]